MTDRPGEGVVRSTREVYGATFTSDLLEQYKLYVPSAEQVSARRIATSRLLLTLNAGLVALYGIQAVNVAPSWWALPLSVLGIIVSVLWYQIIESHRSLNAVKFDVIHELEQHFPAAPYTYEWRLAQHGQGRVYRAVTRIERWVPWAFVVLHVLLFAVSAFEAVGAAQPFSG